MKTIGITGGIGSGKTTLCRMLEAAGAPVYEADARTKALYDSDPSLVPALEAALGTPLRGEDGKLDRRRLAGMLFADSRVRETVEAIVHPKVLEDFLAWRDACGKAPWKGPGQVPFVVFESAIVLEKPLFAPYIDKVVWIDAPERDRIRRSALRDGVPEEDIRRRAAAQRHSAAKADALLVNDADPATLLQRALDLLFEIWKTNNNTMDERLQTIHEAAAFVEARLGGRKPVVGIVLGSGLGKLADQIENPLVISYRDIPGFPVSTAIGHKGNYIIGTLAGKTVIAMQGRIHFYEGYGIDKVVLPIRVMQKIGIKYLFVSNAAGACTSHNFHPGDLMIIRDHINMIPNPLIGPNHDEFGPRFPDMTRPYDPKLIARAKAIAARKGIPVLEGTYLALTGPTYETPAEYRFFRAVGADAVGMSTVPEVIVARHSDLPVFGMSVITDVAHDDYSDDYVTNGEAIVAAANAAADKMSAIFSELIESL